MFSAETSSDFKLVRLSKIGVHAVAKCARKIVIVIEHVRLVREAGGSGKRKVLQFVCVELGIAKRLWG
jgi:hypothetical protein